MDATYNMSAEPVHVNTTFVTYETVKDVLHTYVVPIIILTGFIGNTICFIVFTASPLSRISTSAYLAALSFSDTGLLGCLGISWLEALGIRLFHTNGICQITVYASFVFSFTSIWFVNIFTMEMYIAVFHPEKGAKLCVPKKARIIVVLLFIIAAVIYIHVFWITRIVTRPDPIEDVCMHEPNLAMLFSVFDTVLTLIVPFVMIIVMMTRLLLHITKFYKSNNDDNVHTPNPSDNMLDRQENPSSSGDGQHGTRQRTEARTQLTRMLVVTVLVFLLLNLPSHAIKVQFLLRYLLSERVEFTETEGFIQVIFQTLYYSNFSINFLLYSASGKSFRSALLRVSFSSCVNGCKQTVLRKTHLDKNKNKAQSYRLHEGCVNNHREHSRLVDIHLQDIRESQLPSMESQFIYHSPPCMLALDSETNQN